MPALPITIGELTDVPTYDSPIASPWAQDATRRVVHRFSSAAERDSKYPANTAGAGAVCTILQRLYTSDGTRWAGPVGITGRVLTPFPAGSGSYWPVRWAAQTAGPISMDDAGNITVAPGYGGLWLASFSLITDVPVNGGYVVQTRVVVIDNSLGTTPVETAAAPPGTYGMSGTCSFNASAAGFLVQVQVWQGQDRNCTGGILQFDRIAL